MTTSKKSHAKTPRGARNFLWIRDAPSRSWCDVIYLIEQARVEIRLRALS
ncbi:MAG: hypothetical protein ACI8T1_004353 [Verrucomicrobiales bacterium]|jgi:hypothetical protein